ncbi:MAG: response regulator [Clostridia bacterium]|nr:response regulator [Clostridia bacterium]
MYQVMIVDDEQWSIKMSEKLFHWEEYGFNIAYKFTDARKALDAIRDNHVDVLLIDIRMPGISGLEAMEEIRKTNSRLKIIILSGYSLFEFAQAAIKLDVFEYCLKPLSEDKAIEVITRLKERLDQENGIFDSLTASNAIENVRFNEMIKYINSHYREKLYLNELAENFEINLTYCCFLFKKYYNCGFNAYLTDYKMKQAAHLLRESKMDIDRIAEYLNYDYVYFNKLFKKHFDKTPRQYRAEHMKTVSSHEE